MAEGHRERLRRRFDEENIDTIPDYIVLERILQGVIARRDTRELARTLIKEFGGLPQVIDAPISELCKVPGMGETSASYIKLIPAFYRKYYIDKWEKPKVFNSVSAAADFLSAHFIGYNYEALIVLCLDAHSRLIACRPIFEGSVNALDISVKKILQFALTYNASRVILGHNHISGDAFPSASDLDSTIRIYNALRYIDVALDDHIIVAADDYISLSQSDFYKDWNSGTLEIRDEYIDLVYGSDN